jgi:hypothetical protein
MRVKPTKEWSLHVAAPALLRLAICLLMAFALVPSALPAQNTAYAAGSTTLAKQPAKKIASDSVTVIGDSVVLGAKYFASMKSKIANTKGVSWAKVDAKGSRQLGAGVSLIKQLKKKGKLGSIVVIGLTTNGAFGYAQAKAARKACGSDRYVVFINGYNKGYTYWKKSNAAIKKLAAEDSKVFVADWYSTIKSHGFSGLSDGHCHLNGKSGSWYVSTVIKTIKQARAAKQALYTADLAKKLNKVDASSAKITKVQGARAVALSTEQLYAWAWQINLKVPALELAGASAIAPTFSSSKPAVAKVGANGVVTGKKAGSAVITVKYGTYSATLAVKVK